MLRWRIWANGCGHLSTQAALLVYTMVTAADLLDAGDDELAHLVGGNDCLE
jgi:hypothetical protein